MTGLMILTALQLSSSVEAQSLRTEHWCSLYPPNTLRGRHEWKSVLEPSCLRRVQMLQTEVVEDLCVLDLGEVHLLAVAVSAIQDKCSASDLACYRICMCLSGF